MQTIFTDHSALVDENGKLRNRVPGGAIEALGAQSNNDVIVWEVQDFGAQGKLLVGRLVIDGREQYQHAPPTPPQRAKKAAVPAPATPKKKGGKKAPAPVAATPKKKAAAPASPVSRFGALLGGAAPAPAVVPTPKARAAAPAPAPTPVPKGGKKGGAKKAAKKGAVAYQVPG